MKGGRRLQLDTQRFLRLAEQCKSLAMFDIEATGLKGDYNSILVVSIKPFGCKPRSYTVERPGEDKEVVIQACKDLSQFDAWVSYFGKGFDFPMINTRALSWGLEPLERKPHIDMYYMLKANLLTGRRSQAHLLEWLDTPEKKMSVSPSTWNRILANPTKEMPLMVKRCESDVKGLEHLYRRTSHLIRDVRA